MSDIRMYDSGQQIICVGRYAYRWDGPEPLAIGDRVKVPGNWLFREPSIGVVTALGTTYDGPLANVLQKMPPETAGA